MLYPTDVVAVGALSFLYLCSESPTTAVGTIGSCQAALFRIVFVISSMI